MILESGGRLEQLAVPAGRVNDAWQAQQERLEWRVWTARAARERQLDASMRAREGQT